MLQHTFKPSLERLFCVGLKAYCQDAFQPGPLSLQSYATLYRHIGKVTRRDWREGEMDCIMWIAMVIGRTDERLRNCWLLDQDPGEAVWRLGSVALECQRVEEEVGCGHSTERGKGKDLVCSAAPEPSQA